MLIIIKKSFYGAKPEVLFDAIENTRELYPNLTITGGIDGYTSLSAEVVEIINRAKPDFSLCSIGISTSRVMVGS